MSPGKWWYKITYYGGNQTRIKACDLVGAAIAASQDGRVAKVEEMYSDDVSAD